VKGATLKGTIAIDASRQAWSPTDQAALKRGGGEIAEPCPLSHPVVDDFNVLGDSRLARSRAANRRYWLSSVFKVPRMFSIGALSQQSPLRAIEDCMPNCLSRFW